MPTRRPRLSDKRARAIARAAELLSFDGKRDPHGLFALPASDVRAIKAATRYLRDVSAWQLNKPKATKPKKEAKP